MTKARDENSKKAWPVWQGKWILIVEDEEHNYTYIHEILKRTKVGMIRAESGSDAIRLFTENKIDLILMDIKLPDMDGYKTTQEIKKLDPNVPVVAQTAYAMVQEREKCLQAGCDDYISKPYDPDKLIGLLGRYINL